MEPLTWREKMWQTIKIGKLRNGTWFHLWQSTDAEGRAKYQATKPHPDGTAVEPTGQLGYYSPAAAMRDFRFNHA